MAKELAMVENNEQGRTIRRYFIEAERQWREGQQPQSNARLKDLVGRTDVTALDARLARLEKMLDAALSVPSQQALGTLDGYATALQDHRTLMRQQGERNMQMIEAAGAILADLVSARIAQIHLPALERLAAIEEKQESTLQLVVTFSRDNAMLTEIKALQTENAALRKENHGLISAVGRVEAIRAKSHQPNL